MSVDFDDIRQALQNIRRNNALLKAFDPYKAMAREIAENRTFAEMAARSVRSPTAEAIEVTGRLIRELQRDRLLVARSLQTIHESYQQYARMIFGSNASIAPDSIAQSQVAAAPETLDAIRRDAGLPADSSDVSRDDAEAVDHWLESEWQRIGPIGRTAILYIALSLVLTIWAVFIDTVHTQNDIDLVAMLQSSMREAFLGRPAI